MFGERMGWEKPLYFHPHHSRGDPPAALPRGTFGKPEFFDFIEVSLMWIPKTFNLSGIVVKNFASSCKFQTWKTWCCSINIVLFFNSRTSIMFAEKVK